MLFGISCNYATLLCHPTHAATVAQYQPAHHQKAKLCSLSYFLKIKFSTQLTTPSTTL